MKIPIIAAAAAAVLCALVLLFSPALKSPEPDASSFRGSPNTASSSKSAADDQQSVQSPSKRQGPRDAQTPLSAQSSPSQLQRISKGPKGTLKLSNQTESGLKLEVTDLEYKSPHFLEHSDEFTTFYNVPMGDSSLDLRPGRYRVLVWSPCGKQVENLNISSGVVHRETYTCIRY